MKSAASKHDEFDTGTLAGRLRFMRGAHTQKYFAEFLRVATGTYQNYERGARSPDAAVLECLVELGWNANWILTGEGPELLKDAQAPEGGAGIASHDVSEEALTIALEITDDIIQGEGARYVPRTLYARLLRLMYQGVTQGLPMAEVRDLGGAAARKSLGTGDAEDDGKQEVGRAGQGGGR